MKKILSLIISIIFMTSVFICINTNKAYADPLPNTTQALNSVNFTFKNNLKSVGVAREQTFSFSVNKNWSVKEAYLNLVFNQSPLTLGDESTLTVQINGINIYSVRLAGKNNFNEQLKIPINESLLKSGVNEVLIETHRRIGDDLCADDANSANWIEFNKDSYVHLNYINKASRFNLNEFPYPFISNPTVNNNFNIVTEDNPNNDTLSAIMSLSAYLGRYSSLNGVDGKVTTSLFTNEKNSLNNNTIFIGSNKNLPQIIKSLLTTEEINLTSSETLIKNVENPMNKSENLLLIIGQGNSLSNAIKFLDNSNLLSQVNESSLFINDNLNTNDLISKNNDIMTFKDLGYNSITLRGPLIQSTTYNFSIPSNLVLDSGSTLNLKFKYAKDLDFNRALVTVYINNIPIGSQDLVENKGDDDSAIFTIPDSIKESSNFNVKVEFNLAIKSTECPARDTKNPWAFISNESYLKIPTKERDYYSFSSYPFPFIKNNQLNNVLAVLPNQLNDNNLTEMSNIFSYIGRYAKYNNGEINVIKASEFTDSLGENKNILAYGTPNNNSLIKTINNSLYLKYNEDYKGFQLNNSKIQLMKQYSENIAAIELIKSPFNKNNGIMVVTSPKEADLSFASNILSNTKDIYKLKGNVSILDSEGNIKNYSFDLPNISNEIENTSFTINKELIMFILFCLVLLIVVVILLRKKIKKNNI